MQRNVMRALALFIGVAVVSLGLSQSHAAEPAKPSVSVVGVNAGKATFSNVGEPDVKIPLTLENTGGQTLKYISIEVSPFTAATGEAVEAKIEPAKLPELPAQATTQFKLIA